MTMENVEKTFGRSPAEDDLIHPWLTFASSTSTLNEVKRLVKSCKVQKDDRVSFSRKLQYQTFRGPIKPKDESNWLSCWVAGSDCKFRTCSDEYGVFDEYHFHGNFSTRHFAVQL